jgi:antitoxin (DNA-binding transcriptional repressor) of toxin-antitoxin stability system
MARKSDTARAVETRISATEASRFSKLLDEVEEGRRFVVHRRGRDLCTMAPASLEGRRASECLELLRARSLVLLDEGFGDDLLDILEGRPVKALTGWSDRHPLALDAEVSRAVRKARKAARRAAS